MKEEVNPELTARAYAYAMWMKAPMPMVTLFRNLDVGRVLKVSRRSGLKFNMLMCWCVGRAASQVQEFYMLPEGGRLIRYDALAVSTVVENRHGGINSADIPWTSDIMEFNGCYMRLTGKAAADCSNHDVTDRMVIGTSALVSAEIDGAVGMYSGIYNNPFLIWGRYRKRWNGARLTVSFQFHHTQMDGAHAARFLALLQEVASGL
ncbi:MAG: chloramphenicol acetyltransferase [Muribaculaceae bacterium]|nr:chloramphenicol acetyltransferase [Muribaculaceae bacterium]